MRATFAAILLSGFCASVGCMGTAKYTHKDANGGVIELTAKGTEKDVEKLIVKHIGKDFQVQEVSPPTMANNMAADQNKEPVRTFAYRKRAGGTMGLPTVNNNNSVMPAGYHGGQVGGYQPQMGGNQTQIGGYQPSTGGYPAQSSGYQQTGGYQQQPQSQGQMPLDGSRTGQFNSGQFGMNR